MGVSISADQEVVRLYVVNQLLITEERPYEEMVLEYARSLVDNFYDGSNVDSMLDLYEVYRAEWKQGMH